VIVVALRHPLVQLFGPRNVAFRRPVTASSTRSGTSPEELTNGDLEAEMGLHTEREERPWAQIDLGATESIGSVRVYNRADGWEYAQVPLELSASDDGVTFWPVAATQYLFTQALPWRIRPRDLKARYLRLTTPNTTTLCLSEVEVYKGPLMAWLP
jgi:hypothetical protein